MLHGIFELSNNVHMSMGHPNSETRGLGLLGYPTTLLFPFDPFAI